ncbi:hypothetical protein ACQEUU_03335 [Nonomuraea sp. CA-218870]|uniref:hypothetical protein n=1 Tax=Nonomuraea sp. CA-218870 TaxID=3239998 RepID=UPI003D8C617E
MFGLFSVDTLLDILPEPVRGLVSRSRRVRPCPGGVRIELRHLGGPGTRDRARALEDRLLAQGVRRAEVNGTLGCVFVGCDRDHADRPTRHERRLRHHRDRRRRARRAPCRCWSTPPPQRAGTSPRARHPPARHHHRRGGLRRLGLAVSVPGLSRVFGCRPVGPVGWSLALGCAAAATLVAVAIERSRTR